MLGRPVGTLSDRLTDLEQTVQSQRTTPATEASASQIPSDALASVEQAFTHEVERLKDEWERAISGQCDLLDFFERKQRYMDKQLTGLKSFTSHVESFLEQHFRWRSPSSVWKHRTGSSVRERQTVAAEQASRASSSSTRPPPYVQMPEAPTIPAPPIPSDSATI